MSWSTGIRLVMMLWLGVMLCGCGMLRTGETFSAYGAASDTLTQDVDSETLDEGDTDDELSPLDDDELQRVRQVEYVLQPGDTISLRVFREPELSGDFRLNAEGIIRHPLLGAVALRDLPVSAAEQLIEDKLAADYLVNPRLILSVAEQSGMQVLLMGEVRRPGPLSIPHGETLTLLEAIARAGGFTDMASPNRVRVVRTSGPEPETIHVRVGDVLAGRGNHRDIPLEPNDVITVQEVRF